MYHTNGRSIKNTISVVVNCLVGMGLNIYDGSVSEGKKWFCGIYTGLAAFKLKRTYQTCRDKAKVLCLRLYVSITGAAGMLTLNIMPTSTPAVNSGNYHIPIYWRSGMK